LIKAYLLTTSSVKDESSRLDAKFINFGQR